MANEQQSYMFNPTDQSSDHIIQPRPSNVTLTRASIYPDKAEVAAESSKADSGNIPQKLGERNETQKTAIKKAITSPFQLVPIYGAKSEPDHTLDVMFNTDSKELLTPFNWTYQCYCVHSGDRDPAGQPLFQDHIYLFNVIVAFEWSPSPYNVQILERAVRRASDFLFNVTDGWMTFGQVIIGGPELLNCADVQVMATNRLLPRSWVGGLHESTKYMPIRLGRGYWQKNSRGSIPWDEPEAYRVLVHEWAHYALELLDNYVDTHQIYIPDDIKATASPYEARRSTRNVVVPSISPPVESIMSTLEGTSQLTAHSNTDVAKGKQAEWDIIIDGFKGVGTKQIPRFPQIKEPVRTIRVPLPLHELPHVAWLQLSSTNGAPGQHPNWKQELLLPVSLVDPRVNIEHCWVYILKNLDETTVPDRILAQGTLDARVEDGFRLFGAEEGDSIVLIGDSMDWHEKVLCGKIAGVTDKEEGRWEITALKWRDVTPKSFPIIEVQPEAVQSEYARTAKIRVNVSAPGSADAIARAEVYVFPLDQVTSPDPQANIRIHLRGGQITEGSTPLDGHVFVEQGDQLPVSGNRDLKEGISLDGHVFVKQGDTFVIATYSQGGGPPTGSPVGGTPMTPGSSDGNLMIFFADQGEYPDGNKQHGKIRMVTTRWPGGAPSKLDTNAEARGYTYSLCSNDLLPHDYLPTLCIFYDKRTELRDGEAIIHRQDDKGVWHPIPSYRPSGAWYVAAPLDVTTAPRLIDPDYREGNVRYERYRLYWVPRD
ncbi:MAG: hypothetical protein H0X37_10265 [Herpetosiphonaceae bacterium]|nr:hypothetical protein [Herpetosiphonaceae bacterium]